MEWPTPPVVVWRVVLAAGPRPVPSDSGRGRRQNGILRYSRLGGLRYASDALRGEAQTDLTRWGVWWSFIGGTRWHDELCFWFESGRQELPVAGGWLLVIFLGCKGLMGIEFGMKWRLLEQRRTNNELVRSLSR